MLKVDDEVFSSVQLCSRIKQIRGFEQCRSPEGKRYAILLREPLEVVAAIIYFRDNGASVLLLHGDTPPVEAEGMAARAGCCALLMGPLLHVLPIQPRGQEDKQVSSLSTPSKNAKTSAASVSSEFSSEPSLMQFSSGTTGRPKLIHRSWSEISQETTSYNRMLAASGGEPPLILVPVSHSYGLIAGVLAAWERGTAPHIVVSKNPKVALRFIREDEHSIVYAVPFLYQLLDSLSKGEVRYRKAISSGAPLTEALLERLRVSAREVWQQYGCTEIGCISLKAQPETPDEVGRPLSHLNVTVEDSTDEMAGETSLLEQAAGELVVRTGAKRVETGDLGRQSKNGEWHVMGRLDDLINVSGQKVMPTEVEGAINGMAGVKEAVVYGATHSVWGETVKAIVVADGKVREETIRAQCSKVLPGYKVPSVVNLVDEIPRLPSGKISRRWIREWEEGR
ncbi:AMP-binding protein [Paenibacillus sp. HB172176]|uniref:AMP-binding protein n=1 Tax=Paenibacillus sp. HB172176 TaxID=2493690 RepID=UPI001439C4C1|nr:AMP-binding protein [Paenibacillus sp. HB172176]